MDVVDIARWQFGIVTVFHFLFVPLSIGLTLVVAMLETQWLRTRDRAYLRLTKFFGTLLLISFAIGVVTGIVQEFQFGMNWSDYSRFVGDVFGAPLAIEGLLAFFLESTFLGLWIFGWDRLPGWAHAGCMWVVHVGTLFSAYFILAANSWMQHPVGYTYDEATGRAELTDFLAVLTNPVQLVTFPHVVAASYLTAGLFVVATAGWLLRRAAREAERHDEQPMHRRALRLGAVLALVAGLAVAGTGDLQGKVMTEVQPMKMAAAEGLYESADSCAPFSLVTVGSLDGSEERWSLTVPCVLSFLATGSFDGPVQGIDELRASYAETYGQDPGAAYYQVEDYVPVVPVAYWSFRLMMGLGTAAAAGAALVLWLTRRGRVPQGRWFGRMLVALPLMALAANAFGWIFTEMGRQPWVVFGLMTVDNAVSPGVTATEAMVSLVALASVYAVLGVVEVRLLLHTIRKGPPALPEPDPDAEADTDRDDAPLAFAY